MLHCDGRDPRWTSLVQFDPQWRRLAGWTFPPEVIARLEPHSCSGGSWGPDGKLWCAGHDRAEVYRFDLPKAGSQLVLLGRPALQISGQGIAWDRSEPGLLYGIDRAKRQVTVSKLSQ